MLPIGYWLLSIVYCLLYIVAVLALPAFLAPVLAVARAAVLALALLAPVLAVARAAVPALALGAPVLAVAGAAVLAKVLPAPVLALGLARSPALATAKTVVHLVCCVLSVAYCLLAMHIVYSLLSIVAVPACTARPSGSWCPCSQWPVPQSLQLLSWRPCCKY
jgi:hypothetical protein